MTPARMSRLEATFNDRVFARSVIFDFYDNIIEMIINDHESKITSERLITLYAFDMSGNRARAAAKILSCEKGKMIVELSEDFIDLPDRRRALKLPAAPPIPASLIISNEFIPTQIKDISITGVFIFFDKELTIGHKCGIFIESLGVDAKIRIVRQHEDKSGYGCEFVELSPKHEDAIAKYLFQRQIEERDIMKRRKGVQ